MADVLQINTPAWWLHRLAGQLQMDTPRMVLMDRYYRGSHPLPYVPRKLKDEYRKMLARSRSNFMRIVVEAPAERLKVQGFRAAGGDSADTAAWDEWVANNLDVDANLGIVDALAMGRTYLSVWRFAGDDRARIQIEDPRTTIVEFDPIRRHRRVAGLRMWTDDWTGKVRADVWLQDGCYQFAADAVRPSKTWPESWSAAYPIDDRDVAYTDLLLREEPLEPFQWVQQWEEVGLVKNPSGEIPLIPLVNRPSVLKRPDGESELEDVYLTQDRINEMLFNRALAAWTTAYRQKWATGLEIPVDEDGNAVQPFEAAIDRLWVSEDERTRFGEFGATDLKPFIEAVEEDVQHIAVQTRTPRHYFVQQGQAPSGDAIKSAEAGLVAKVFEKQAYLGRGFAEAMRLAKVMAGEPAPPLEVVWADPEFRTMGELTDAVIKQHQAGLIPQRVALERLGYSPTEIDRITRLRTQDQLVADAVAMTSEEG